MYGLFTVSIPTNRPCIRIDHPPTTFIDRDAADRHLCFAAARANERWDPFAAWYFDDGVHQISWYTCQAAFLRDLTLVFPFGGHHMLTHLRVGSAVVKRLGTLMQG